MTTALVVGLALLGAWGLVRAILRIRREERERQAFADQQRAATAAWQQLGEAYRAVEAPMPLLGWDGEVTAIQCRGCRLALANCKCPKVLVGRGGDC